MDPTTLARLALLSAILAISANGASPAATHPTAASVAPITPGASATTYTVQPGDTLYSIALKFNTTVAAIQQANPEVNPNALAIGKQLIIGGNGAQTAVAPTPTARGPTVAPASGSPTTKPTTNANADTYIIKSGDTLATIAAQLGISMAELQHVNNITNPNVISVGQRLIIPQAANPQPSPEGIVVSPEVVHQGDTITIRVTTPGVSQVLGKFDQQQLKFNVIDGAWVALAGISRCANYVGNFPASLTVRDSLGNPTQLNWEVRVNPVAYPVQDLTLTPQMAALLDPAIENAEDARVGQTVGQYTPGQMWSGVFRLPLDVTNPRISTTFGDRRSYNGGKPGLCGHEGTDYAVPGGTPVYAPADGVVVLADPLQVRGNVVFLDHGRGVFSGFYHLSEIIAKPGERVKPGDLLGKVGTTGFSTGNHLHWSMWVNGVYVNPDQWMQQPIP